MPGYKSTARAIKYGGYWVYPGRDTKAREYYPTRTEAVAKAKELNALKKKNPNAFPDGAAHVEKAR